MEKFNCRLPIVPRGGPQGAHFSNVGYDSSRAICSNIELPLGEEIRGQSALFALFSAEHGEEKFRILTRTLNNFLIAEADPDKTRNLRGPLL